MLNYQKVYDLDIMCPYNLLLLGILPCYVRVHAKRHNPKDVKSQGHWLTPTGVSMLKYGIPSGEHTKAMENGHRNSGFSH